MDADLIKCGYLGMLSPFLMSSWSDFLMDELSAPSILTASSFPKSAPLNEIREDADLYSSAWLLGGHSAGS